MVGETVAMMKVTELRNALKQRGLPTDGLKSQLVMRLQARLDEEEFGMVEDTIAAGTSVETSTNTININNSDTTTVEEDVLPVVKLGRNLKRNKTGDERTFIEGEKTVLDVKEGDKIRNESPSKKNIFPQDLSKIDKTSTVVNDRVGVKGESKGQSKLVDEVEVSIAHKPVKSKHVKDSLTMDELKAKRAARFGIPLRKDDDKYFISDNISAKETLSFEERKLQRAARFNIPLKHSDDSKKIQSPKAEKRKIQMQDIVNGKKPKKSDRSALVLSKEEIVKRLERAEKYGNTDVNQVDHLKAMLRLHRFGGK